MTPDKDKPPLEDLIAAARGETEVDLLLEGAEMVNVLSGDVHRADIAVYDGWIVGYDCMSARDTLDVAGTVLSPGFIDAHVHIESAMVSPQEYARAVAPRGTTSVMIDPHEIANVLGLRGIGYMLDASEEDPAERIRHAPVLRARNRPGDLRRRSGGGRPRPAYG